MLRRAQFAELRSNVQKTWRGLFQFVATQTFRVEMSCSVQLVWPLVHHGRSRRHGMNNNMMTMQACSFFARYHVGHGGWSSHQMKVHSLMSGVTVQEREASGVASPARSRNPFSFSFGVSVQRQSFPYQRQWQCHWQWQSDSAVFRFLPFNFMHAWG